MSIGHNIIFSMMMDNLFSINCLTSGENECVYKMTNFKKVGIEILYWLTEESVGGARGEKGWIHLLTM